MTPALRIVTWEAMSVVGVMFVMAYIGLVIMGYATEGPRYPFTFDVNRPAYSAKRMLVGLGVRLTAWILHVADLLLNPLFEASAEVGERIIEHSSRETQARYRSRFM